MTKISTIGFGVGNLKYVSDYEIERIFSVSDIQINLHSFSIVQNNC